MNMPTSLSLTTTQPDDELLIRAKAGDQAAWSELYAECLPKLIRAVRKKLTYSRGMRQVYDSTDIANDVWKSLAASWDSCDFPNQKALIAHLLKEADRKFIDRYRNQNAAKNGKGRMPVSFEGLTTQDELSSDYPTPSAIAVGKETLDEITRDRTEQELEIIKMKMAGYSTESVSQQTGWHEKRIQRFLKLLRDTCS